MHDRGVDVLGAERGLAALERVEQRRPRGRAITRRQQRLAAQALELHAETVERIARGQGLGQPLRAIERGQRAGVIAGAQQRVGPEPQHVRSVEARLSLLRQERGGGLVGERRCRRVVSGVQRGRQLGGEQQRRGRRIDVRHDRSRPYGTLLQAGYRGAARGGRDDALRVLEHDAGTAAGDARGHHDAFGMLQHDPGATAGDPRGHDDALGVVLQA